jgi:acetone carboxylase gamma subunit
MNAQELFNYTVGLAGISASNASNYLPTYIHQLNNVLAETFKLENNNRVYKGVAKLEAIPYLTSLEDTVPYQDNIVLTVLPYGVLTHLQLSDDDVVKTGYYNSRYADNMRLEGKLIEQEIEDVYGVSYDD